MLNNSISHVIREMQVKIAGSCCSTAVTLPHWRKQGRSLVVDGDVGSRSRSGRPFVTWASLIAASSAGKESACNAGDPCSIPGSRRSPGEGIGYLLQYSWASGGSPGKASICSVGDLGSICGLGRALGEGNGYPLWYSGLENSMHCTV